MLNSFLLCLLGQSGGTLHGLHGKRQSHVSRVYEILEFTLDVFVHEIPKCVNFIMKGTQMPSVLLTSQQYHTQCVFVAFHTSKIVCRKFLFRPWWPSLSFSLIMIQSLRSVVSQRDLKHVILLTLETPDPTSIKHHCLIVFLVPVWRHLTCCAWETSKSCESGLDPRVHFRCLCPRVTRVHELYPEGHSNAVNAGQQCHTQCFFVALMPQIMVYSFCLSWLIPAFCFRNQVKTIQNHTYPYIFGNLKLLFHSELLRTYDTMNGILAFTEDQTVVLLWGLSGPQSHSVFFTSDHVAAVGDAVVGLMFCSIFCGQIQLLRLITLENGMGWISCDQLLANKI